MNIEQLDAGLASHLEDRKSLEAIGLMCDNAPSRRVVWWGCQCAWSLWRPAPPEIEDDTLRLVVRWVVEQSDESRANCAEAVRANCGPQSKWLLQAAVNSGGALKTAGAAVATPTPDVAGKYVNGFLQNLLASIDPVERHRVAHSFIQLARQALVAALPGGSTPVVASPHVEGAAI